MLCMVINLCTVYFVLQHHRGRAPSQEVWVFGMVDTTQSPALGVMRIVPDRSAATLLPIMQQHLRSGTTVHSDEWASYNTVQQLSAVTCHTAWGRQPLTPLCGPNNWGPHTECGVILESCEDQVQENEGGSKGHAGLIP